MDANERKKEIIAGLIEAIRNFRFCGPSDDPDEITGVTAGYRHLTIQLKKLAGPMLPSDIASQLNAVNVEINDLYSAYDADSELKALLPDVEAALASVDAPKTSKPKPLPVPVCSIVGDVLGGYHYHHKTLEQIFYEAGAVGGGAGGQLCGEVPELAEANA